MLAVTKKTKIPKNVKDNVQDIITYKIEHETIVDGDQIIIRKKRKPVNITKTVNETKKLVKQTNTQQLIAKIDEIKEAVNRGV